MSAFSNAISYGWHQLASRRIYMVMMLLIPLAVTFFFVDLMSPGLPLPVPSAVVDLDHSSLSRRITRNLRASQAIDLVADAESFNKAVGMVRTGEIFGFFVIPADFEKDALGDRPTAITYYCNMTFFVPGTMIFKGFKAQSVVTVGGLAVATLQTAGLPDNVSSELVNPVNIDIRAPGNPWLNYNVYLTSSFIPALLALLIALITSYSILVEIKDGTSPRWLSASGNSMILAVMGKLIPQFLVWSVTGMAVLAILYGFSGFPLNCPFWHMVLNMELLIMASQWFAVIMSCAVPNLRLAVSFCSLTGILAFSIAAFSFPVEQMYGAIGIFSYILPVRYYFLTYIDQALNGLPLYYSRWFLAAQFVFPLIGMIGMKRLYNRCINPVYAP